MTDFLADNNLCGQTILKIVSKGNGILADILRLKDTIPPIFRLETKADVSKYGDIIIDLGYLVSSDAFEAKIEKDPALLELDNEVRETYLELLTNFYLLFESVYKYVTELNKFVEEVQEGTYIQMSLEAILFDKEGKQLLVRWIKHNTEALYLYGVMLLLIDFHIDGIVRERMLTSFYRYSAIYHHSEAHVDDVCKLFRSTGYTKQKKASTYPVDYFGRVSLDNLYVQMTIGALRSEDIYNQIGSAYPFPEHRTTALSTQASMLAISLFFSPKLLTSDNPMMREVTDKFFSDNWVVPVFMGFHINLIEWWDGFKAAKLALGNSIENGRVKQIAAEKAPKFNLFITDLAKVQKDGVLTEENILERATKVINLLRDCNVLLRWITLHAIPIGFESVKRTRQVRDIVIVDTKFSATKVLNLLLLVAQLEQKIKELFRKLLDEKRQIWNEYQQEAKERVTELSEVFSGNKPLTRIEKNDNLCRWLETKSSQIGSLNFDEMQFSGRKIIELIRAFEQMLEFHGLESKVQVKEWVNETVSCLHKMLRTGAINEDKLVMVQVIGDLGYAWSIIDHFTPEMQSLIKDDPSTVSQLRAPENVKSFFCQQLASAMDMPLVRIGQVKSTELLVKVSSYFSGELVAYVQKVLQIIPESVFLILHQIISLQTNSIKELPTRLEKEKVKEYAQLEERLQVARLTHHMSVLAQGILMMQTTLVGIIRLDPKRLLENGIRKELVGEILKTLEANLVFGKANSTKDGTLLKSKLKVMALRLEGIKRSLEYIGDYVNSNGLRVFQEEFSRVLNFATEQECNSFTKAKILNFQSIYQSKEIPIPLRIVEQSTVNNDELFPSITFIGRLANELLHLTDPKTTLYLTATSSWYDLKSHVQILTPETFSMMEKAIGITGLTGLDKVVCFLISENLQKIFKTLKSELAKSGIRDLLAKTKTDFTPHVKIIPQPVREYTNLFSRLWKGNTNVGVLFTCFQKIGQLQLIRRRIQYQLRVAASFHAKQLSECVSVLDGLLADATLDGKATGTCLSHDEDFALPYETVTYSEPLGLYDPYAKVYVTVSPMNNIPLYLTLLTINQIHKLTYSRSVGSLICRKLSDPMDGMPFAISLSTFFFQLHSSKLLSFIMKMCQYMNSVIVHCSSVSQGTQQPSKDDLQEIGATYYLLHTLTRVSPRKDEILACIRASCPCWEMIPSMSCTCSMRDRICRSAK
ncbi:WASH complex subunit strumpellin, partial [Orchesella cincta]